MARETYNEVWAAPQNFSSQTPFFAKAKTAFHTTQSVLMNLFNKCLSLQSFFIGRGTFKIRRMGRPFNFRQINVQPVHFTNTVYVH